MKFFSRTLAVLLCSIFISSHIFCPPKRRTTASTRVFDESTQCKALEVAFRRLEKLEDVKKVKKSAEIDPVIIKVIATLHMLTQQKGKAPLRTYALGWLKQFNTGTCSAFALDPFTFGFIYGGNINKKTLPTADQEIDFYSCVIHAYTTYPSTQDRLLQYVAFFVGFWNGKAFEGEVPPTLDASVFEHFKKGLAGQCAVATVPCDGKARLHNEAFACGQKLSGLFRTETASSQMNDTRKDAVSCATSGTEIISAEIDIAMDVASDEIATDFAKSLTEATTESLADEEFFDDASVLLPAPKPLDHSSPTGQALDALTKPSTPIRAPRTISEALAAVTSSRSQVVQQTTSDVGTPTFLRGFLEAHTLTQPMKASAQTCYCRHIQEYLASNGDAERQTDWIKVISRLDGILERLARVDITGTSSASDIDENLTQMMFEKGLNTPLEKLDDLQSNSNNSLYIALIRGCAVRHDIEHFRKEQSLRARTSTKEIFERWQAIRLPLPESDEEGVATTITPSKPLSKGQKKALKRKQARQKKAYEELMREEDARVAAQDADKEEKKKEKETNLLERLKTQREAAEEAARVQADQEEAQKKASALITPSSRHVPVPVVTDTETEDSEWLVVAKSRHKLHLPQSYKSAKPVTPSKKDLAPGSSDSTFFSASSTSNPATSDDSEPVSSDESHSDDEKGLVVQIPKKDADSPNEVRSESCYESSDQSAAASPIPEIDLSQDGSSSSTTTRRKDSPPNPDGDSPGTADDDKNDDGYASGYPATDSSREIPHFHAPQWYPMWTYEDGYNAGWHTTLVGHTTTIGFPCSSEQMPRFPCQAKKELAILETHPYKDSPMIKDAVDFWIGYLAGINAAIRLESLYFDRAKSFNGDRDQLAPLLEEIKALNFHETAIRTLTFEACRGFNAGKTGFFNVDSLACIPEGRMYHPSLDPSAQEFKPSWLK